MSLVTYNNNPFNLKELGSTYLTGLARELQQLQADPLAKFLPVLNSPVDDLRFETVLDSIRLTGVVAPGQNNGLNTMDKGKTMKLEPAHFRRGDFIDAKTINILRQPGTENKIWGMGIVERQMRMLVDQANMMFTVLRAQLFNGAINYTDPMNPNYPIQANSGIPAANYYTIGAAGGAHADFNAAAKWTDLANSKPVDDLLRLKWRTYRNNIAEPDTILMNGVVAEILMRNEQIRSFMRNDTGLASNMGFCTFANGMIDSICGMKVVIVNTVYDEDFIDSNGLVAQRRKYVLPVNKVVVFASRNPQLPGEVLGHTVMTPGENLQSRTPGIWVETWDHKTGGGPTSAPGVGLQIGMSGIPFFMHPGWVNQLQIADVADVTAITGNAYVV